MKKRIYLLVIIGILTFFNYSSLLNMSDFMDKMLLSELNIAGSNGGGVGCFDQTWEHSVSFMDCLRITECYGSCWNGTMEGYCQAGTLTIYYDTCEGRQISSDFVGNEYFCY